MFILRTCLGLGDWGIISALPKLIKQRYPNMKVYLPSRNSMIKLFQPLVDVGMWSSWKDPYENPYIVFKNNPYIDGIKDIDTDEIYHDHYRIYDDTQGLEMLIQQMLRFFRMDSSIRYDILPELYFDDTERNDAAMLFQKFTGVELRQPKTYNALLLSNRHDYTNNLVNKQLYDILRKDGLPIYYYSSKPIHDTMFGNLPNLVNIANLNIRTQLLVRSNAKRNVGTQSGITDTISQYTQVFSVKHSHEKFRTGNYIPTNNYISSSVETH